MKKGTWIVFGLVVMLGLLYFLSRESQVSVGVKQLKLPTFASDKIERIEIHGKNPVELVKQDTGWNVRLVGDNPRAVRADKAHVEALLEAAQSLRPSHYVTNLKEKYSELGFSDDQQITVKLSSKDSAVFALVLGRNASGAGRYVKLPDQDDIFEMRGSFWQLTRNGAIDFRDREIWPIKEGEIDRFSIVKADGSEFALVKEEAGSWKFDDAQKGVPEGFRVDKTALMGLVRAGANLRASGFVDEAKTLMSPQITVKASSAAGSHVVEIFADGDKVFARRVGDEQIYEIGKNNFDRLNLSLEALRDLSVLTFDKASINEVRLKHNKQTILVRKVDNQWRVIEPAQLPENFEFDPAAVDDMLTLLSGLRAERIAMSKDQAVMQDWQKSWLVELVNDKNETTHLFVGKTKASKEEFLVRGSGSADVYVVKAMRLSSLQSGLNAFKKEEFNLPPIDENTKGFNSLPIDVQRKLLNVTKEKK